MPDFKSYKVPRLAGFASPSLKDVLLSGAILQNESGEAQQFTFPNCWRGSQPGPNRIGSVHVMPMNKGIMVMPQKSVEQLALKGDVESIFKMVTSIGSLGMDFLPLPKVLDVAWEIGGKVSDALELEYDGPFDKNQSRQKYFRTIVEDKKTFYMPYIDIVEASYQQFGKETGLSFTAEHADGTRDYCSITADSSIFGDFLIERRWRQEFEQLVVAIIDEAIGGQAFWQELTKGFAQSESSSGAQQEQVQLSDLSVDDIRMRFFLGPHAETYDAASDLIAARLEAAGYREISAITTFFLFEATLRVNLTLKDDGRLVWLALMTDPKLAGQLIERMQPSLDEFREAMTQNEYIKDLYRLDYVEMLERSARDEHLGRVMRHTPGAFY